MNKTQNLKTIKLLGVNISTLRLKELLNQIVITFKENGQLRIANVNIFALNLAYEMPYFRQTLNNFDIVFCDGVGVQWAANLTGQSIPERYTPPDFANQLCQILIQENRSLFLLGAKPKVAERAALILQKKNKGLIIAGTQHGYFDKKFDSIENQAVIEKINQAQPSLLLVAFGMPQQEEWLAENWSSLKVNVALTVGALFDTLAGDIPRAPRWITDYGFEWLARLIIEPKRLWKRYLIGNPLFFWRLINSHFQKAPHKND